MQPMTGWRILIALDDQKKTTITCPDGTFKFEQMALWLCNTPATFQLCIMSIFYDMVEDTIEMLDRLVGKRWYCFLDGYSGYNQLCIAPEDQQKTTFTFPYNIFAVKRMPSGLCNAPATF
uniref:Reverse transcriptase domain-containing protein n=1 Tax=Solanum lycopersicum TaxID=4081 RepID=A0A3Q7GL21_SOLLC